MNSVIAHIALGSNLGDRAATIRDALSVLHNIEDVEVTRVSELVETEPVGPAGQDAYLNAAASLKTTLPPRELLNAFLAIEAQHGRARSREQRWGPRTLDIDLLLYGNQVIDEPGLTVPHPRMHERIFVLEPMAEIAPQAVHPVLGATIETLLARLLSAGGPEAARQWHTSI